jgi:hypothetical protein
MTARIVRIASALALVLGGGACGSDGDGDSTTTAPASSSTAATTPETTATTATTGPPTTVPVDTEQAIWPFADGDRYDTPEAAAQSFAVDYLGYTETSLGELAAGDGRSGEIEVRAGEGLSAFTTVLLRRLSDDTWWVIGAVSPDIQPTSPESDATITSPVSLAGSSVAFEANVNVEIRVAGSIEALVTDFVMGGSMEMGPYAKDIEFPDPGADEGVIVLRVLSMKDGGTEAATVTRVRFG